MDIDGLAHANSVIYTGLRPTPEIRPPHLLAPTTRLRTKFALGVPGQDILRGHTRLQQREARLRAVRVRALRRGAQGVAVGLWPRVQRYAEQG